jgi:hypothetical protein
MTMRSVAVFAAALCAAVLLAGTSAGALTMQECSAKYKAAQAAGSAKGMKWNDFRKAECGADASAAPATTSAPATPPPKQATTPPPAPKQATTPPPAPKQATAPSKAPAPASAGNAVYPTAVAPKYSSETAGKARMHTCLDQYNANKASNANGGLNWIQKGGGYYSECNKRLKS